MSEEQRYTAEEFPMGLRCMDCDHLFEEGEVYSQRLEGFIEWCDGESQCEARPMLELICVPCALGVSA